MEFLKENDHYIVIDSFNDESSSIVIPSTHDGLPVTKIGERAFSNIKLNKWGCIESFKKIKLKEITIPSSINYIGQYAFDGCEFHLGNVYYDGTIDEYFNLIYDSCSLRGLADMCEYESSEALAQAAEDFECSIDEVENYLDDEAGPVTFDECLWERVGEEFSSHPMLYASHFYIKENNEYKELTDLVIPNSINEIPEDLFMFFKCKSVVISQSVTRIKIGAFYGCQDIKKVYYVGTKSDFEKIVIDDFNNELLDADRYYYSEEKCIESGNYWHYVDGVPTIWK